MESSAICMSGQRNSCMYVHTYNQMPSQKSDGREQRIQLASSLLVNVQIRVYKCSCVCVCATACVAVFVLSGSSGQVCWVAVVEIPLLTVTILNLPAHEFD